MIGDIYEKEKWGRYNNCWKQFYCVAHEPWQAIEKVVTTGHVGPDKGENTEGRGNLVYPLPGGKFL